MTHHTQVDIAGHTAAPGDFLFRCSCGTRVSGFQSWDAAERAGRQHESGDQ